MVCANQWDNAMRDGKCFSDGFIVAKDDFSDYYVAKRYYAMAHFSKCIPNGSKSLISALILVVAFRFLHLKEQTAKR